MDIFDVLTMLGGLSLFLFGMNIMGQALESRAGNGLRSLLGKMTSTRSAGFLTGCGVTAAVQSSSATTVMVVGFVNSGLMTLHQAINVIMGANVGTTVTSWILSLGGIDSNNPLVRFLKPISFTSVLAFIGIIIYMFCKSSKKKDIGLILLGFSTLMFGMNTMSSAVESLADVPEFQNMFLLFQNPILGVLAGALLTAIIQSSSASVGILQALAVSGRVSYGAVIPIVMGQNIGTCITTVISSIGTNKNAKRAAFIHLSFNLTGAAVLLAVFSAVKRYINPSALFKPASLLGIAAVHTVFNLLCAAIVLPLASVFEKLAVRIIHDDEVNDTLPQIDERLLATPSLALEQCKMFAENMAHCSVNSIKGGLKAVKNYTADIVNEINENEKITDRYEDILGTCLIKLSTQKMSDSDSEEATKLLKIIGDFERISDHGVNLLKSAEEIHEKKLSFSASAKSELNVLTNALTEILDITIDAFLNNDTAIAFNVEPLEQVIDSLKEKIRTHHILRMQQSNCSIEVGFVFSDILTDIARASDHCSNIAGCIIDTANHNLNLHKTLNHTKRDSEKFKEQFDFFANKYSL